MPTNVYMFGVSFQKAYAKSQKITGPSTGRRTNPGGANTNSIGNTQRKGTNNAQIGNRTTKKNISNLPTSFAQCCCGPPSSIQDGENGLWNGIGQSQVPSAPKTTIKVLTPKKYYPPACSAYDMAYTDNKIFVYGGIPCNTQLSEGLKQHFYEYNTNIVKDNAINGGNKK